MAYIGKSPIIGNFVKLDSITTVNGQAAYTMQNGGSNFTDYESVNQFLVSLNGTIQAPTDSFTVSGSTLTFASNLSTGDVIDFVMVFGNSLSAGVPTDATVSLAKLTATGTKDATTFLRGDNTFATPSDNGKILNVYQVRTNTAVDVTSTSYVDIGLSQAVTPVSSSSKFLLRPNVHYSTFGGGEGFNLKINRAISGGASTDLNDFPTNGAYLRYQDANANFYDYFGYEWLDEPATASAITYKLQAKVTSSGSVKFSGYNSQTVSMFTIMEVSG